MLMVVLNVTSKTTDISAYTRLFKTDDMLVVLSNDDTFQDYTDKNV